MKIKVLGTGCTSCKLLFKNMEEVICELGIDVELEKVEDLPKIMAYGVMSVPALVIDEKVIFAGKSPSKEELKKYLTSNSEADNCSSCGDCCC